MGEFAVGKLLGSLAAMAAIIVLGLNFVLLGDAFGIPVPFLDG